MSALFESLRGTGRVLVMDDEKFICNVNDSVVRRDGSVVHQNGSVPHRNVPAAHRDEFAETGRTASLHYITGDTDPLNPFSSQSEVCHGCCIATCCCSQTVRA